MGLGSSGESIAPGPEISGIPVVLLPVSSGLSATVETHPELHPQRIMEHNPHNKLILHKRDTTKSSKFKYDKSQRNGGMC
jgi:hypothetical protein